MSRNAAKWVGPGLATLGALGLTVAGLGRFETKVTEEPASAVIEDLADVIRVRALADAATLGVSGLGCDGLMRGSGFVVGDTAYTNRHLVEGGEAVKFDQLLAPVLLSVNAMADDLDVATADAVDVVALEFADRNPAIGATVFVAGHAGGRDTQVIQGTVHLYGAGETWGVGGNVMLIDAETEAGFSGGPVLDVDGRVVGMLQGVEPTIGLTLAIPVEDLRTWSALDQEATPARCQR